MKQPKQDLAQLAKQLKIPQKELVRQMQTHASKTKRTKG